MIVIEKDAEIKLLDELNRIKDDSEGYRFIHYSFSTLNEEDKSLIQELLTTKIIAETINNPDAKIFIFQDSDVVILGNDIFTKTYDRLTLEIYKISQVAKLREISRLYDVSNSWPKLYNLAKKKYEPIVKQKSEKKIIDEKKQAEARRNYILQGKDLDQGLVKTIAERRTHRTTTNILIVEDDAFSRKLIRNVLNKDYNVIDVEDGRDALSSYVLTSPDLVFLDIDLPDVTGHDILQLLMKVDPQAFVVMLSGNSDQENVIKAVKEGAKGFVAKPFLKDRLFKYIKECPTIAAKTKKKEAQ